MINVGIIGCGFVGGALKDWLEHNNPECKLFISDPYKGYNDVNAFAKMTQGTPLGTLLEHLHELNVHFRGFEEHI